MRAKRNKKQGGGAGNSTAQILPKGGKRLNRYNIIYADPPWQYRQKRVLGAAEHHYKTMNLQEICALPVSDIADENCVLFLWATFPQIEAALRVITAWGFTYKTLAFLWLKQNKSGVGWFLGLGFWTRGNAEICLLATKGKPKCKSHSVRQFLISPVRRHSQKPDEARVKILELMGDVPRVELFARQKTMGWDTWGNEVQCDITLGGDSHV